MRTSVLWAIVVLVVATLSALGTIRAIRPARPDLSNTREWTLIKLDRAASSPKEMRVYLPKHLSSTWDPYTVEQNKIVAVQDGRSFEFMWPTDRQYAAGWSEVIRLPDGRVEVLLFESPSSVRLVLFNQGQFSYRPEKDELLSVGEITYSGLDHDGVPEFVATEGGRQKLLRWAPEAGFTEVSEPTDGAVRKQAAPRKK
jgi:hypothetical protein